MTKPPGSLGRLEDLVAWLAHWQGHAPPRLDRVEILVFAGNHGVTRQGVSAYPAEVTVQMVANFAAGGAAINQLARAAGASLRVIPLSLDTPTADFTESAGAERKPNSWPPSPPAMRRCRRKPISICLGEMGIGNTTAAAAIAAALVRRRRRALGRPRHRRRRRRSGAKARRDRPRARSPCRDLLHDPLAIAAALGGRELAAILGAALAARRHAFRCCSTALSAPPRSRRSHKLRTDTLAHAHRRPRLGRSGPSHAAGGTRV